MKEITPIEEITIPNYCVKSPISLWDIGATGILVSIGANIGIGLANLAQVNLYDALAFLQHIRFYGSGTFSLMIIASSISSLIDVIRADGIKQLDLKSKFGCNKSNLPEMQLEARVKEMELLVEKLNDEFIKDTRTIDEMSGKINNLLTEQISKYTQQRVYTSDKVRTSTIMRVFAPRALGAYLFIGQEVYLLRNYGIFNPHIVAHELSHRKGYRKELDAQILAYITLNNSDDLYFRQSANAERLVRQINVCKNFPETEKDVERVYSLLRTEFKNAYDKLKKCGIIENLWGKALYPPRWAYMKLTKQDKTDYSRAFTNFLYAAKINP